MRPHFVAGSGSGSQQGPHPKAKAKSKAATTPRPSAVEAHVLPHQGLVALDQPSCSSPVLLVHLKTLERKPLPPGEWQLDFDDEGFAALTELGGERVLLVEDYLHRTLCTSAVDELLILEGAPGEQQKQWSLTAKLMSYEEIHVKVKAGPTMLEHGLPSYFLTWPRQGCRFFWDAICLYTLLCMSSYKGVASKWFYESYKGWQSWLSTWGLGSDNVMQSTQTQGQQIDPVTRFLPSSAVSSTALVALLARWGSASVQHGGLRDRQCRAAAVCLLEGIVKATRLHKAWQLELRFDPDWKLGWPLSASTAPDLTLEVDDEGFVCLSKWHELSEASLSRSPCCAWLKALTRDRDPSECSKIPVYLLLCGSAGSQSMAGLFGQVMWQLGQSMEKSAFIALKKGSVHRDAMVAAYADLQGLLKRPSAMNAYLLRYVMSGLTATAGHRSCSMAVDKANVGGLGLQSGAFVLPDNTAILAVPQAISGDQIKKANY
jgi:hypothetical protein